MENPKIMAALDDCRQLCEKYKPSDKGEVSAMIKLLLVTAATLSVKMNGLSFSVELIRKVATAGEDGLNDAIYDALEVFRDPF